MYENELIGSAKASILIDDVIDLACGNEKITEKNVLEILPSEDMACFETTALCLIKLVNMQIDICTEKNNDLRYAALGLRLCTILGILNSKINVNKYQNLYVKKK